MTMSIEEVGSPGCAESSPSQGRVLVVDDEPGTRRAFARVLERQGYEVVSVESARAALEILEADEIEAVVSDISMPDMDGVALIAAIRQVHPALPVIFATGAPSVESAAKAVDHGAFKYLPKPVEPKVLTAAVAAAVQMGRQRRDSVVMESERHAKRRKLEHDFGEAIEAMWMAYQPIISWSRQGIFGFEALLRNDAERWRNPAVFIAAAEELEATAELGRAVRGRVATDVSRAPEDALLFVNLHAKDLVDEELFAPGSPLVAIAHRVVLEVTERASLDNLDHVHERVLSLRRLGYRLAIDDLGAGYNSLNAVALLEPDVVKLDMSLVRDVHTTPTKQRMVRAMVTLAHELGAAVVAEGVETEDERACLCGLGCDLLQGYLFAKPQRDFVRWPTPTA